MVKVICHTCNNEFEAKSRKATYCSHTCKMIDRSRKVFPDGSDFVECKECGIRAKQLIQHIEKVHKMSIDDYCEKHINVQDMTYHANHCMIRCPLIF